MLDEVGCGSKTIRRGKRWEMGHDRKEKRQARETSRNVEGEIVARRMETSKQVDVQVESFDWMKLTIALLRVAVRAIVYGGTLGESERGSGSKSFACCQQKLVRTASPFDVVSLRRAGRAGSVDDNHSYGGGSGLEMEDE